MKCKKCNNEIQNGFKFCPICGTPVALAIICPKCGATDIPQDSKFCPDCGILLIGQRTLDKEKRKNEALQNKEEKLKRKEIQRKQAQEEAKRKKSEAEAKKRAEESKKTYINGHEYIDLGLPSGTLWATCNIGASTPEECGNKYAWGEVEIKSSYTQSNSKWKNTPSFWMKLRGVVDSNNNLTSLLDVATRRWGTKWHIPTFDQYKELKDNTKISSIVQNGKHVCLVTSLKNGKSIILPSEWERMSETALINTACYWSSTKHEGFTSAYYLSLGSFSIDNLGGTALFFGYFIRPVSEK